MSRDDERLNNLIVSGVYADNEEMGHVGGLVLIVVILFALYCIFS